MYPTQAKNGLNGPPSSCFGGWSEFFRSLFSRAIPATHNLGCLAAASITGSFVLIPAAQRPPTVECSSKDFNIFFTPSAFSRRLFGPGLFLLLKQTLGCR